VEREDAEFVVTDERRRQFGVVYQDHVDSDAFRDLTPHARCVYYALLPFVGYESRQAWPKVSKLAGITGFSRSTVFRSLRSLQDGGFIHVGKKEFNRYRVVNLYTLLSPVVAS